VARARAPLPCTSLNASEDIVPFVELSGVPDSHRCNDMQYRWKSMYSELSYQHSGPVFDRLMARRESAGSLIRHAKRSPSRCTVSVHDDAHQEPSLCVNTITMPYRWPCCIPVFQYRSLSALRCPYKCTVVLRDWNGTCCCCKRYVYLADTVSTL
jgi:hypothetical protein